jgi:hypothetical protein
MIWGTANLEKGRRFMDESWKDEIRTLMDKHEGPCVSIFLPTHRSGQEMQQNPIRLRNMLREAEEKMHAAGIRPPEAKALLDPAMGLVDNVLFWRRQGEGLAIFFSADVFRYYSLPTSLAEAIVVANRFHLKPFLPLLSRDERFFILTLSANEVKVLRGTEQGVTEIDVNTVPKSLADALRYDELQKHVRFRAGTSGAGRSAMLSGSAAELDDAKDNLLKYFRQIDRGLRDLLREERAPLVLAGVDYLFPIFREAGTYPYIMEEGIAGNPSRMSLEQLHRQAWAIVERYFQRAQDDALAHYRDSSGTGLTSNAVDEIVPAASHGRVGLLFVAQGCQRWGAFDPDSSRVQVFSGEEPNAEDLLDLAAMQTYLNGGTVFALAREKMPEGTLMAAVYRY